MSEKQILMNRFEKESIARLLEQKELLLSKSKNEQYETNLLIDLLLKFGTNIQFNIAIEEMSELTKELTKLQREIYFESKNTDYSVRKKRIIEEITDVEICIEQIKLLLSSDDYYHGTICRLDKLGRIKALVNRSEEK